MKDYVYYDYLTDPQGIFKAIESDDWVFLQKFLLTCNAKSNHSIFLCWAQIYESNECISILEPLSKISHLL